MWDQQAAEENQTQLLGRIAAQDRQALAELYDQLAGLLFSNAVRILSDPHEAEEVIQDVFVQIWEKAATFDRGLGTALHWTLSITRNRAIDRLRARQRRARVIDQFEQTQPETAGDDSLAQPALAESELASIRSAVNSLPAEQRQAIELAFFRGLTHIEIAEALKEPLGTIKARIRRGMLRLREGLRAYV